MGCRSTTHLFTAQGLSKNWPSRIASVLDISVAEEHGVSPHVCSMCIRRVAALERSAADLQAFKTLAKNSLESQQSRSRLKRTRGTGGVVGISPDTARARPSSKLSRRQLIFQCK